MIKRILVMLFLVSISFHGYFWSGSIGPAFAEDIQLSEAKTPADSEAVFNPHADIQITETHYVITVKLPGIMKEDITVEAVSGRTIVISGKKNISMAETNSGQEKAQPPKVFTNNVILPDDANTSDVSAEFKNEELKISVGKTETQSSAKDFQPKKIEVK